MTMGGDAEERLRRALGDQALRALKFHVSKILNMDFIEALERDPEAARRALEEFFKSSYAAGKILELAGVGHGPNPPTREAGGRGWEA
jgi:hypothetical protein